MYPDAYSPNSVFHYDYKHPYHRTLVVRRSPAAAFCPCKKMTQFFLRVDGRARTNEHATCSEDCPSASRALTQKDWW